MKVTRILMGMPVTVEVVDKNVSEKDIDEVYEYFKYIDEKFSPFKKTSELSKLNMGISPKNLSSDMKKVLKLCEQTKKDTLGFFNIYRNGKYNTSGLVKGWAIKNAADILKQKGFKNYFVDAGGDIELHGKNKEGKTWKIGIRNPFNVDEIVKTISVANKGVATSGTYERGEHVYNPKGKKQDEIVSLTVIAPNVYEADRFATACFAMGEKGILFLEKLANFEGYMINKAGLATQTSGFQKYVIQN